MFTDLHTYLYLKHTDFRTTVWSKEWRPLSSIVVAQWLRCCATNRKVAGSIPDGVNGIFYWHNPSGRTMALGLTQPQKWVEASWNVMAHGDAREGKWRGNWRMQWVTSTLHTTSEHGVSSITTADGAQIGCQQSTELTPPGRFKWTRPFRRKTKSGFSAFAITFQLAFTGFSNKELCHYQWRTEGGLGCSNLPPPKFWRPSKIVPNSTRLWKLLKIAEFRKPTTQDVAKKGSKILKLRRFAIVLH